MPRWANYKGRKCIICGSENTYILPNGKPFWRRYYDKKGNWDRKSWLCNKCYADVSRDSDWRKGNLDPDSPSGKGFIGSQIVAKVYMLDDCNIVMNNFNFYIDISKHSEYGRVEVKTSSLKGNIWSCGTNRVQEYDTLLFLCMDENKPWKCVERVYAIPWEIVVNRGKWGIYITKNPSRGIRWYEEFRIDEKLFNNVYQNMKLDNCSVLRNRGA